MERGRYDALAQRTRLWALLAAACFLLLAVRLGWVQVVRHSYYEQKAKETIGRHWPIPAPRGSIYDRNQIPLALNLKLYAITADPKLIVNKAEAARRLAPVLCLPEAHIGEIFSGRKPGEPPPTKEVRFVRLREDVDERVATVVEKLKLAGIIVKAQPKRVYPHGTVGAGLIGFVGKEGTGWSGIERRFNTLLAGEAGQMFVMLDGRLPSTRTPIPDLTRIEKEMQPGQDLVLTIDLTLQRIADEALAEAVEKAKAKGGTAVVMDPKTGEILALANQPTFDPNQYQISDPASWVSQAVTSPYEPGSTFKSITACAALESGVYANGETYSCSGSRPVGNRTISCAHGGHGQVRLHDMIVRSCNVGLGTVALALGPTRLYTWVKKLGFGERTGIEIPGETSGLLTNGKYWSQIQTANIGFGQGISVTPIQLLSAYCTIANGGYKLKPHIVKMILSNGQMESVTLPTPERILSEETCEFMRNALHGVVSGPHGTGSAARIPGRTVAGKTGTAQKPLPGIGYHSGKYIGSFIGFAPVSDPRLAIIVVIDEPKGSYYGGVVAAPAFQKIMEKGLAYLHVPPDDTMGTNTGPGGSAAE